MRAGRSGGRRGDIPTWENNRFLEALLMILARMPVELLSERDQFAFTDSTILVLRRVHVVVVHV